MHLLISFITITIILIKKRYKKLTSSNKAENNIHHEKSERLNRKLSIRAIQNCVIHKAVMHTEYTHAEGHCGDIVFRNVTNYHLHGNQVLNNNNRLL